MQTHLPCGIAFSHCSAWSCNSRAYAAASFKGTVMAEAKAHSHSLLVQDSVYEHRTLSLTSPALLHRYYQWDHLHVCAILLGHLPKTAHRFICLQPMFAWSITFLMTEEAKEIQQDQQIAVMFGRAKNT
jgi:hypothetical protein